jgi:hypothetical protein
VGGSCTITVRLRQIRNERSAFDGRFFERLPEFWPIRRAASVFADAPDWPDVVDYGRAFTVPPPVCFAPAPVKRRRPPGPIARADLYDATIVLRRTVPTRARMWHDYLNALVWTTFPRAKLALHRRQHRAIEAWIPPGATQLPNARSRELDTLALVDEGGVLLLERAPQGGVPLAHRIIFGHALFEGLVFEQPAMVARSVVLTAEASDESSDPLELADRLLAEMLEDTRRFQSPTELRSTPLQRNPARRSDIQP